MSETEKKTLGKAIDEIVAALSALKPESRATAVRAACEHVGLPDLTREAREGVESSTPSGGNDVKSEVETSHSTSPHERIADVRTLKEQKQPTSAIEMACIVAYYLDSLAAPTERKKEVSSADLEKYFKQGGYRLPKRMPQILVNARASGYFDTVGHGKYRLNAVGHNLVVHGLPKTTKK
jgi:hypothetical protein